MFGGESSKAVKHYVVVRSSMGGTDGYYESKQGPAAAAKKAANVRFGKAPGKLTITIRQTTAGLGKDREFTYEVERVKLAKPQVIKRGDKQVKIEYDTKIKAVKK